MLTPPTKRKSPEEELAIFQATHTFKNHKKCHGQGHIGKRLTEPEKGRYMRCSCAKRKEGVC